MVRVLICEDDVLDLTNRYGSLITKHDVKVRLIYNPHFNLNQGLVDAQLRHLKLNGFDNERVRYGLENLSQNEADIFFVDGLVGLWRDVMARLPRGKTFLNSDNPSYSILARRLGYQVLEGSVEDKIREIFGNK